MEKAKVGIIEDAAKIRLGLITEIEAAGHDVDLEADTESEATAELKAREPGSLDVLFVDANLTRGIKDGAEGDRIAKLARETLGDTVSIVGISLTNPISGANADIPKSNVGAILAHIESL